MKKFKFIHTMMIVAMSVTFLIDLILTVTSIKLFGAPSVISAPLLISVFFIMEFLAIFLSKGDTFRITEDSIRFKIWQTIYKIFFIIDAILAPVLFTIGVITTIQNILERC